MLKIAFRSIFECSGFAYTVKAMNKRDLAAKLARESHSSCGKAADDVDSLVYDMLRDIKNLPAAVKGKSSAQQEQSQGISGEASNQRP